MCVSLSERDHGCVDACPDPVTGNISVTENTFLCPRCHRDKGVAMIVSSSTSYNVKQLLMLYSNSIGFKATLYDKIFFIATISHFSPSSCHGVASEANLLPTSSNRHWKSIIVGTRAGCVLSVKSANFVSVIIIEQVRIVTRALKAGNNRPKAMEPAFDWMRTFKYQGNLLIFVNTHSDTETGNLVVSGNAENPESLPIHEVSRADANIREFH